MQPAGLAVDEAGAGDRDRPHVDRRVAQQDGDRGEVAQVEVGIDDDGDALGRWLAGPDAGGLLELDEHAARTAARRAVERRCERDLRCRAMRCIVGPPLRAVVRRRLPVEPDPLPA